MKSCTHGIHFWLASIVVLVAHIVFFSWTWSLESCTHGDHFLLASIVVLVAHIVVFSWTRSLEVVGRGNRSSCTESARQLARATDKVAHLTDMNLLNGEKMHIHKP